MSLASLEPFRVTLQGQVLGRIDHIFYRTWKKCCSLGLLAALVLVTSRILIFFFLVVGPVSVGVIILCLPSLK